MTLLVINYVMDPKHFALAHQVEIVEALAKNYKQVIVITGDNNWINSTSNIEVRNTNWTEGHNFRNIFNFYRSFFRIRKEFTFNSVFSHMTVIQSGLVAPLLKLAKTKHVLWYAHAANSFWLKWTALWVDQILTSTPGSCPIRNSKVLCIGQSLKPENFLSKNLTKVLPLDNFVHIGRLDKSKNIDLIIESVSKFKELHKNITLSFYGSSSSFENRSYVDKIKNQWSNALEDGWLKFNEAIPRADVSSVLIKYDLFIHAFIGSLDKSLIEATLCGLPVATLNTEYQKEFGYWSRNHCDLFEQLESIYRLDKEELTKSIIQKQRTARKNHSFNSWVEKVTLACS